jgi:hypothetical protein
MANIIGENGHQKLDLSTSKPIVCAKCGGDIFIPGSKMRKISKLITGTDQDVVVPFEILLCGDCGEILEEMLPTQLLALEKLDRMKKSEVTTNEKPKSGLIL